MGAGNGEERVSLDLDSRSDAAEACIELNTDFT